MGSEFREMWLILFPFQKRRIVRGQYNKLKKETAKN